MIMRVLLVLLFLFAFNAHTPLLASQQSKDENNIIEIADVTSKIKKEIKNGNNIPATPIRHCPILLIERMLQTT